jgi:hypothetical protein
MSLVASMKPLTIECPKCGTLVDACRLIDVPLDERLAARVEMLRQECDQKRIRIVSGEFVYEKDAARLLDRTPGHLANLRAAGRPIPCRQVMGRWMYKLQVLAAVFENCDDE